MFRDTQPRWFFAPYWIDAHPDHVAATELIEAARFWAKLTKTDMPGRPHYPERIFYYYCIHLRLVPQPAFVLDISDFWGQKRAADRMLPEPVHRRPAAGPAQLHRPDSRPGRHLGLVDRRPLRRAIRLPRADWIEDDEGSGLKGGRERRIAPPGQIQ